MHFTDIATVALSLLATQATAKTIKIDVGKDGLVFTPDSITANKGDVLEYHFYKTHSVAMGEFATGCTPASKGGFYSGIIKSPANGTEENKDVFQVTINGTDPIAFYCTVGKHCQAGMVGVVNPSSKDSLDAYKKVAADARDNKSPDDTFGGTMVEAPANRTKTDASQTSSTATGAQPTKTAAASQMKASLFGGVGAAAIGFALLLV